MLDSLHCEDYAQCLHTKFAVRLNDASVMEVELIDAEDKSPSPRNEQFVLTFLAPAAAPIAQGLFPVRHDRLGEGVLFLVPIARDARGVTFEAVFNRLRQEAQ